MDSFEKAEIVDRAVHSVKWSGLGSLLPRLITPLSTAILAALLSPTDFGLVAISNIVLVFAQILVGLGLSATVVQRRTEVDEAASAAFWLNIIVSIILYGGLWYIAPFIAQFYQTPQASLVIQVTGFSLILYAFGGIPEALLQRRIQFHELFWVRLSSQLVLAFTSVGLAVAGAGVWALVFGSLSGVLINTLGVWIVARWQPMFILHKGIAKSLIKFGFWVMLASFQSWLFLYADNAILGYYQGSSQLGIYALGFNLSLLVPSLIVSPLSAVAYPVFCKMQDDKRQLGRMLLRIQRLTLVLLAPLIFGVCAVSAPAIDLLYGDRWTGLAFVVSLLSLNRLGQVWSLNSDAYRAIERPDIWPKMAIGALIILLPMLFIAGPYGLKTFTIARLIGGFALPIMNIFIGPRILFISLKDQVKAFLPLILTATSTFIVAYVLLIFFEPFSGLSGGLKLIGIVLASGLSYGFLLWRFHSDLWLELTSLMRSVVFGRDINANI